MLDLNKYFTDENLLFQMELNNMMIHKGNEKFYGNEERLSKEGSESESSKMFVKEALGGFASKYNDYVNHHISLPCTNSTIITHGIHEKLSPYDIGTVVIKSVLSKSVMASNDAIPGTIPVIKSIGVAVENLINSMQVQSNHEKEYAEIMGMLRRQGKNKPEEIKEVLERFSRETLEEPEDWEEVEQIKIGTIMLELFLTSEVTKKGYEGLMFSDIFLEKKTTNYNGSGISKKISYELSEIGERWLKDNEEYLSQFSMSYLPMVIPPRNWVDMDTGGYYAEDVAATVTAVKSKTSKSGRIVRMLYKNHPEGYEYLFNVLNILQSVPFRVNEYVWEAVKWCHDECINLDKKGIPTYTSGWVHELGEENAQRYFTLKKMKETEDKVITENGEEKTIQVLTGEYKEIMNAFYRECLDMPEDVAIKDLLKAWGKTREAAQKFSRAEKSKKILIENTLKDSKMFFGRDIFFLWNADYRSRAYPVSSQFSPQGSDVSRGLLNFAISTKVTSQDAIDAIAIHIANCFGEDKISLKDRIMWVELHTKEIIRCAEDFKKEDFWRSADKPFLALQGCKEWQKVINARESGDPFNFYTNVPVAYDGSINGCQNYSALYRDPKGAASTNLIDGEVPADGYQDVADRAAKVSKGKKAKYAKMTVKINEETGGKLFSRKAAKRPVMCTPYAVSKRSAAAYVYAEIDPILKEQGLSEVETKGVRKYVSDTIWDSIKHEIGKPIEGKDYLQSLTQELMNQGKGVVWRTPTKFRVGQLRLKKAIKNKQIKVTVNGKVIARSYPVLSDEIDEVEQLNAVAPNFIHSMDSAHLQKTITAAHKEGMENFLVIHDSFSTDAEHATRFNHIIREQFVEMYSEANWLDVLHKDVEEQLECEAVTPKQELGDFDITKVLESKYFFS